MIHFVILDERKTKASTAVPCITASLLKAGLRAGTPSNTQSVQRQTATGSSMRHCLLRCCPATLSQHGCQSDSRHLLLPQQLLCVGICAFRQTGAHQAHDSRPGLTLQPCEVHTACCTWGLRHATLLPTCNLFCDPVTMVLPPRARPNMHIVWCRQPGITRSFNW